MRPTLSLFQKAASSILLIVLALSALTTPALAGNPYSPVFLRAWGGNGDAQGQFASPYGIAVSSSGWVYVADSDNHRIQVFDADGVFQAEFGAYGTGDGAFRSPRGIDFDTTGALYVVDSLNDRVQKFTVNETNKTFTFTSKFGASGTGDGQFVQPYDLAVDRANGKVYVADTLNHRLQVFTTAGAFVKVIGTGRGSGLGQFNYPSGVAVDSAGNLYVADTYNNRVVKYSASGSPMAFYGGAGTGNGQFSSPRGVDINSQGDIIVADTGNHRIQKLAAGGSFLAKWGSLGDAYGQFTYPFNVAHQTAANNEDKLYVIDRLNDRVQQFEPNAAPTALALNPASVAENQAAGATVGTLTTTDTNTNDSFTYTLVSGTGDNDNASFTILGSTLKTAAVLDYETKSSFSIRVRVTDSGGLSFDKAFTISVTNQGEAPILNDVTFPPVSEGAGVGYVAGTLAATDNEPGDALTYSETGGTAADAFDVLSNGQVVVADPAKLDFETKPTVTLNVQVTDSGGSDTAVVTLYITDYNDVPVIQMTSFTVAENQPWKQTIGYITATDEDNPVQSLTFALLPEGNPSSTFALTPDGRLWVNATKHVNYETYPFFDLNVTVTDNGLPSRTGTAVIRVNLTDVNEPMTLSATTIDIPELSPAGPILTDLIFATDPEQSPLTWTVVSCETFPGLLGAEAQGVNASKQSTGALVLLQDMPVDFENNTLVNNKFTAEVSVTDGQFTANAIITIRVINTNEPPTIIEPPEGLVFSVTENSPVNTKFADGILGTDPDLSSAFGFSIIDGDPKGAFYIGDTSNVGYITVYRPKEINYEVQQTYTLTIKMGDNGYPRLYDTATVTVNVLDANDPPVFSASTYTYPLVEGSPNGTVIATLGASDEDNDPITYSFISGTDLTAFEINAQGQLVVKDTSKLNAVTAKYYLTVRATDTEGTTADAFITVRVSKGNTPPILDNKELTIKENLANGTLVIKADGKDPDIGSVLMYAFKEDTDSGAFAIDPANGNITVKDSTQLNYEAVITHVLSVTVEVTDNGVPQYSTEAVFTFNLENVNEKPVLNDQAVNLPENSLINEVVYTPAAQDEDAGSIFSYEILSGNDAGVFSMDPDGRVRVADPTPLDFETNPPPFVLTIQVTDNGIPAQTDTAQITFTVTGMNELPTITGGGPYTLAENSPVDTPIDTFTATDPDLPAQDLTFSILGGNTGSAFKIDPVTGALSVANPAAVNYETSPTFTLTIRVTDNGSPVMTAGATVTINLTNVNEAPVVEQTLAFTVKSDKPQGFVVGQIAATDPEGSAVSYEITSGNTGGAFAINANGEITVADPAMLNPETHPTFTLIVLVSDASEPANISQVTVTITVEQNLFRTYIPLAMKP